MCKVLAKIMPNTRGPKFFRKKMQTILIINVVIYTGEYTYSIGLTAVEQCQYKGTYTVAVFLFAGIITHIHIYN